MARPAYKLEWSRWLKIYKALLNLTDQAPLKLPRARDIDQTSNPAFWLIVPVRQKHHPHGKRQPNQALLMRVTGRRGVGDRKGYGPSDAEQRAMLRCVMEVGPLKPIGYLPLSTIRAAKTASEMVASSALTRGLAAIQFPPEACCIRSGALYVYDRAALNALLKACAAEAAAAGLPVQSDAFVAQIASVWYERDHPAHPIIAAAFGET
jgi:hypothetical protein